MDEVDWKCLQHLIDVQLVMKARSEEKMNAIFGKL